MAICLQVAASGCVHRRLTIRSNPPGALVYVDNYEIGTTPVATDYIYYGTRQIRLVKDGYETLTVKQYIPPPWYQIPPLDFVSENLVPGDIRDERNISFNLVPQVVVPTSQLLSRAENLRQSSRLPNGAQPAAPAAAGPGTLAPEVLSAPTLGPPSAQGGSATFPLPEPGSVP